MIYENWERIITMIARRLSMDLIAREIGVSERTLWRTLKELGISTKDIQNAYEEMKKAKEQKIMLKMEKIKAPPTSWSQFKELAISKEFIKYCVGLRRTKKEVAIRYLSIIYKVCKDLMIHPTELNNELIEKWYSDLVTELGELSREPSVALRLSEFISAFRVFGEFKGFSVRLKTKEYKGKWNVYFTKEDRKALVKLAYEVFNKEDADFITTIMETMFRTGMRAKALTKISNVKEIDREIQFEILEKGKQEQYLWIKRIPKDLWIRLEKYLPITDKKLDKIRKMLVKLYAKYFGLNKEMVKKIKSATLFGIKHIVYVKKKDKNGRFAKGGKEYVEKVIETPKVSEVLRELRETLKYNEKLVFYAIRHPLHIWRHTFAIEMLNATGWNYSVVAKLGGWVKEQTLANVYGILEYEVAYKIFKSLSLQSLSSCKKYFLYFCFYCLLY